MGHLRAEFWALPAVGDPVPLPDLDDWSVSPTDEDAGAVEINYPVVGRRFELLRAITGTDVDLEVEIRVRDTAGGQWVDRALFDEAQGDDVEDGAVWKFTGRLLSMIFDEVVVPWHPTGENGETAVSGTAGKIMRELLQAAQGRGCLAGVTWDFTDTHDSAGVAWANSGNFRLSPGQLYRAILGSLRGYGLSEWQLTSGRVLRLHNIDGKGVDRTASPTPLTLERGRDLQDAPRRHTLRGAVTALVTSGKDGLRGAASSATALARRGRRIEGYYSFGNADDQGTLNALTSARLGTVTDGRMELSHKVVLGPGHPTPLIDFQASDWVFSATRAGVERRRVKQITLRGSKDEVVEANVTVGSLIDDVAVRQQKRIDDLASGAVVVGTSNPAPEVDDGTTPAAPLGSSVVATSIWYPTNEGVGLCSVTAAWTAVPDATVVGYVVEWRYTEAKYGTTYQRRPMVEGTSVTWSGVAPGAQVQVRVYAVNRWGRYSPASSPVYSFVTELDGTPPAVPTTPAPYTSLGLLVVPWAGKGVASAPMPGDFARVEVHRSTTSGFTPSRPLLATGQLDESASTTYVGALYGAGELPVDGGTYGTTYYVRLVAVDRTGNASAASAQGSVVLARVADGEIADLSIGKLTAGIMSALMTVSGIIRTAASGSRVELDTTGFRCFFGSTQVLGFTISTGALAMIGKLTAGAGVGGGRTVVIEPATPEVALYPNATAQRIQMIALNDATPDGGVSAPAFKIRTLDSGGSQSGPIYFSWDDGIFLGHQQAVGTYYGARLFLQDVGGASGMRVGYRDAAGFYSVQVVPVGDIFLNAKSGRRVISNEDVDAPRFSTNGNGAELEARSGADVFFYWSGGTLNIGSGGSFVKTFVIPHPVDPDRWLVHGCIEAPEAGVEYRGVAELVGGQAVVELPSYFEAATRPNDRTVHLTMLLPAEPLAAEQPPPPPPVPQVPFAPEPAGPPTAVPEQALLHPVAASVPRAGRFRIASPAPDGTRIAWLVKAVRADVPELVVEPLRSESEVRGDGPYTYIADREDR